MLLVRGLSAHSLFFHFLSGNVALNIKSETCFKDDTTACTWRKIFVAGRPSNTKRPAGPAGAELGGSHSPDPGCWLVRPAERSAHRHGGRHPPPATFVERGQLAACPACSRESTDCAEREEKADGADSVNGKDWALLMSQVSTSWRRWFRSQGQRCSSQMLREFSSGPPGGTEVPSESRRWATGLRWEVSHSGSAQESIISPTHSYFGLLIEIILYHDLKIIEK